MKQMLIVLAHIMVATAISSCNGKGDGRTLTTPTPTTIPIVTPKPSLSLVTEDSEAERTYPVPADERVPSWDDVLKGMKVDASITPSEAKKAMMEHVAKLYQEGGEKFYHVATGEVFRDMPKSMAVTDYAAMWLVWHTPERSACYERNTAAILNHHAFKALAESCLFKAKSEDEQKLVARSIARKFCLGGEEQVDYTTPPSKWKKAKQLHGTEFRTVTDYVDLLLDRRGTEQYCKALKLLQSKDLQEKMTELYRTLEKQ